jgi:hypothetical protein
VATLYLRHLFAIRTRPSLRKSLAPEAKALLISARQCPGIVGWNGAKDHVGRRLPGTV